MGVSQELGNKRKNFFGGVKEWGNIMIDFPLKEIFQNLLWSRLVYTVGCVGFGNLRMNGALNSDVKHSCGVLASE